MAILSKIRERSMALIIVIGLALFAFVLDPSTLEDFFNSSKVNEVGAVDGEAISRQEFAQALEAYRSQTGNRVSEMQAAKTVWDNLVRQKIYKEQLAEAGITIGEEDVWQEVIKAYKTNPQFTNEAGFFDEEKFKEFLNNMKNTPQDGRWAQWQTYINNVRTNLETTTYNKLIGAGLGASLKEAETQYMIDFTKINGDVVYVPFSSIPDSTVTVSNSEIETYIKAHKEEFKVEASRSISYVSFNITPSLDDETAIKNEVAGLLEDRKEYNKVSNQEETLLGLKNATDINIFFEDNSSDIALDTLYKFKQDIPVIVADEVTKGKNGDTFGPYKDKGYFKITKLIEVTKMPDSVKASHILIPFVGSRSATPDTKTTEAEAKKRADSIVSVVKKNKSKFAELAKKFSADRSNADKGGSLDKFDYKRMVPEFRDYAFAAKKGDVGIAQTIFGYHVIMIEDQNKPQDVFKLATFARKIEASEETGAKAFQNSEEFALELSKGEKINEVARTKGGQVRPVVGLNVLSENISGLGNQRQIVKWAFDKDRNIGDYKRFDIDNGHVVVVLTSANEEGLSSASSVMNRVKPILLKEKKAKLIEAKMNGGSLVDIAKANNTTVRNMANTSLNAPSIAGVGTEPGVLGAMYNAELNKLYNKIVGKKGVFAFVVKSRELPTALPNYEVSRNKMADTRKAQVYNKLYDAIKNTTDIEDNRAAFYGVNE
jgi:parvulin-like peptidyl-prolyl isomerase